MASPAPHLLHFLRSQPPTFPSPFSSSSSSSSFASLLKPLFPTSIALSTRLPLFHTSPLPKPPFPSVTHLPTPPPFRKPFSSSSFPVLSPSVSVTGSAQKFEEEEDQSDNDETDVSDDELEAERSDFEDTHTGSESDPTSPLQRKREERLKLEVPTLTVKERKELSSYAHSLGKKLKSQLVGKSGVTPNLATSFIETLEANELLKIKIHRSCPGELDDVVKQLEESTGSVAVSQIGRTLIVYRPSLTKLKAEEKKEQNRKLFLKRQLRYRQSREEASKLLPRGSSWRARNSRP